MRTVKEVSEFTGVSIRTLHYYDSIGLLKPTKVTDSGYRLYSEKDLQTLQYILLFRELEFPLKSIKEIITRPGFDEKAAMTQQIELLKMRREHIDNLIDLACKIQNNGVNNMSFSAFDTSKIDEYAKTAKEKWGNTDAYKEYESKSQSRSKDKNDDITLGIMKFFERLGTLKDLDVSDEKVVACVGDLQEYITDNFYNCTNEIFLSLGEMYACGGEFTENIDKAGGVGTAVFARDAIKNFCK